MRILAFILVLAFLNSCKVPPAPEKLIVRSPAEIHDEVVKVMKDRLSAPDTSHPLVLRGDTVFATQLVSEFYRARNFEPVFSSYGQYNRKYFSLARVLRDAREFGLIPAHYHWPLVDSLMKSSHRRSDASFDVIRIADVEIMLTDAFFQMAHHLCHGRLDPDSLSPVWKKAPIDSALVSDFNRCLEELRFSRTLMSYEPKFYQYIDLKAAYREYKRKMKGVKWVTMPDIAKDTAMYIKAVRERMIMEGFLDSSKKGNDSLLLARALLKFQKANLLTEDGKVGKEMIKILALSVEDRIRQIEMNLERWRWERKKTFREEKAFVWVNLPGYKFILSEKDTVVVESRIICGDPKHPSPHRLKSTIQYFTIYPYWNVPYSIASKEILPRIKWDTAYLRKHNFQVIDWNGRVVEDYRRINWKKYGEKTLPYKFRQLEGEENSLGLVKFFFNNKQGVYLHDTNSRKLFKRNVRALSHGCMRLEEYLAFAEFLVRDDSVKIPKDTLHAWFGRSEQRIVKLKKPVNIYIRYFTTEVLDWNRLVLYPDIYDLDAKMIRVLYRS
ncbi:MAG: L,D-transpeptidase family protein [Bacteroidia bacterium]|nr:L,D-transpeptidase family protein [Bacteroidia bacterium]